MLYFSLGDFVTHPDQPDWGYGQVQSIVGKNVTVNFEHAGKQMINCQIIDLVKVNAIGATDFFTPSTRGNGPVVPMGRLFQWTGCSNGRIVII